MALITESFSWTELDAIVQLMKLIEKLNDDEKRFCDMDFVGEIDIWERNRQRYIGVIKIDHQEPCTIGFQPLPFEPEGEFNSDAN